MLYAVVTLLSRALFLHLVASLLYRRATLLPLFRTTDDYSAIAIMGGDGGGGLSSGTRTPVIVLTGY